MPIHLPIEVKRNKRNIVFVNCDREGFQKKHFIILKETGITANKMSNNIQWPVQVRCNQAEFLWNMKYQIPKP